MEGQGPGDHNGVCVIRGQGPGFDGKRICQDIYTLSVFVNHLKQENPGLVSNSRQSDKGYVKRITVSMLV